MQNSREHTALSAYLKLLANKGYSKERLRQKEIVVLRLVPYLEPIANDGFLYREAVDELFDLVNEADWPSYLPVIRDYFSFWINDIKAIAAMNEDKTFESEPQEWVPQQADLQALWASLDKVTLTLDEIQPLASYEESLRAHGADDFFVDTRKKLVKLLLLRLREAPHKQPSAYRKVVDSNLPLFTMEETHHMFLKVGREFYYFWKGDSEADKQVLRNSSYLMAA
jgi:hypothetical protein